ncbi:MAG: CRISPR-associated protein Cas4 [Candidatus Nitrosocaldaceae archaeon]
MNHTSSYDAPYRLHDGKVITGTLVWYSMICNREVWLMSRDITPDEEDPLLDLGRAIHETSYTEIRKKEMLLEGIKIDIIKNREDKKIICEVKSSSKYVKASMTQLCYYLYRLEEIGMEVVGELIIPKEKKRIRVELDDASKRELISQLYIIRNIVEMDKPPNATFIPFCRRCAYRYFCWSE